MKIAYLILAHRNPKLIKKLIEVLYSEDCAFFIHIDKKSDINDFFSINGKNIFFTSERIPVYWAEYSMVEAILFLIQQALNGHKSYDYFVLLSGSDYPLRSRQYIHKYFEINRGVEFISMVKVPNKEAGVSLSRINTLRIPSNRPVYRFIVKILARLNLAQRDYKRYLSGLEPFAGSTWWALTRDACQYIVDFIYNNKPVCKYFVNSFASDESIFHTILGNSKFKPRIHRHLMYEDWSVEGSGHPAMINEKHVQFFLAHEKICLKDAFGPGELLFARKFSDNNMIVVKQVDDMIKRKDHGS